jgi:hypothetical protein
MIALPSEHYRRLSDLTTSLVSAGAALIGAGLGGYATLKARRPFREELALNQAAVLTERKLLAFGRLLPVTEYGSEEEPKHLRLSERRDLAKKMTEWYYEEGSGLMLSGRSVKQFVAARGALESADATPSEIRVALSLLRTDLKIDLGVREPSERLAPMAEPEQERW